MMILLWGCSPVSIEDAPLDPCLDTGIVSEVNEQNDTEDNPDENQNNEEELQWAQANLVILSPEPSAFITLGEEYLFEAELQSDQGDVLDFTDIEWHSSIDNNWNPVGDRLQEILSVGQHTITAKASLPNGDRLTYAVGGVLVQHPDAGIYAGTTTIDNTINNDTTFSCSGGITVTIDATGEIGNGEGECILSLNGNDIPSYYNFDLEIADGNVGGTAALDLLLIQQNFPLSGTIGEGELEATWTTSVTIPFVGDLDVNGVMQLSRVSLY